jgi:hypothetical protein
MTALELLATLHERGVALLPWVDDRLRVDAPQGVLTDELRQAIRTQKEALLALAAEMEERLAIAHY